MDDTEAKIQNFVDNLRAAGTETQTVIDALRNVMETLKIQQQDEGG